MYVVSKYMLLESIVMKRGSVNLIVWSLCELEFCFEVRFSEFASFGKSSVKIPENIWVKTGIWLPGGRSI